MACNLLPSGAEDYSVVRYTIGCGSILAVVPKASGFYACELISSKEHGGCAMCLGILI